MTPKETDSDYPQPEAEKRRDELLHTLLKTPPQQRPHRERQPHAESKQKVKKPARESR